MPRFTMDFSDETGREIDTLARELHVNSKADVMRKALGLLKYVVEERKQGGALVIENKRANERKEIVTL